MEQKGNFKKDCIFGETRSQRRYRRLSQNVCRCLIENSYNIVSKAHAEFITGLNTCAQFVHTLKDKAISKTKFYK